MCKQAFIFIIQNLYNLRVVATVQITESFMMMLLIYGSTNTAKYLKVTMTMQYSA